MTSLFLFALILGGGLLGLSLVGDLVGGADADIDTDLDTDPGVDAGGDPDMESDLAGAFKIFTIRNLTYFLFGFGAVGWLLGELAQDLSVWVVALAAVLGGTLAAAAAAVTFGWLKATESGWQADEGSFVGCEGRVVLPVGHAKVGQIVVRRGAREHELRALPFDLRAPSPEKWRSVVVIEMEGGTARVSPMEALTPADSGAQPTPERRA